MTIRDVEPADRDGVIALIGSVYDEYGEKLTFNGADADLLDLASYYPGRGGAFVVLADDRTVHGCHGVLPIAAAPGKCTFRRLYLDPALRGQDWGADLMQWAVDWAQTAGFNRVEFWSDTRFSRAHRFFEKFGFQTEGLTRDMDDGFEPYSEYFYWMTLGGQ